MVFLFVILYGLTYEISVLLSLVPIFEKWIVPFSMILYVSFLIFWIFLSGNEITNLLCTLPRLRMSELYMLFPLILLPLFNFITTDNREYHLYNFAFMLSISMAEEIFFRGFLLCFLSKNNFFYGAILSSGIFAIFHVVNYLNIENLQLIIMQILCAFVVGISYSAVVHHFGSLWPTIVAHFLTNISGSLNHVNTDSDTFIYWICIIVHAWYAFSYQKTDWLDSVVS